ncbi:integrase [Pseudomonas sp. ITA]|uniref:integrase n=1 Tax=Pseudomonas sp. ITA TaxID=2825841 RepID=UPI002495E406|nr:integrase [Pseudomonas sp. ITA]MDI2146175.1 integrase [Pseudomonas sp. ITA]
MTPALRFTPKGHLTAQQNLEDFIALSRDRLTLWSDLEDFSWGADRWSTTHKTIRFINLEHSNLHPRHPLKPNHLMHPAYTEVAKAYLRYKHTLRPNKNISQDMQALRAIEFALRQDMGVPDITKFAQRHWDAAIGALAPFSKRQDLCSSILSALKMLADFLIICVDPRKFRNPYVGRHSYDAINGSRAPDEAKKKKVPDQEALIAIAEVFSRGPRETQHDADIMVSCLTGLLLSAPMRIGETLRFRTDCLRHDDDKNGERQYYLAYWVPKIQRFARKAIPKTMTEVAKDAIQRLSAITEEGRRLARYLEGNPTRFFRHANCPDVPDNQRLTPTEVVQALGYSHQKNCEDFIRKHTASRSLKGFTLDSLWQIVLAEHRAINPHFPYQEAPDSSTLAPLKMSESLLCFRRFQLATRPNTSPVLLLPFTNDSYGKGLANDSGSAKAINFFTRNGYQTIKIKSHSLRHLLNRLGRSSGVTLNMLTEWSSRATTRQTRTYLHDDPAKAAANGAVVLGTTQEQVPKTPITREEGHLYGQGPFHRSRYGICRRSWRAGPCNKFADCLNCSDLLMCKGDKIAVETIKQDRDHLVRTYHAAQQAIVEGERSASRWTEKAKPQIERLDQLLAILHNPEIPDGSPLEMAGENFSHEKVIVSEKAEAAGVKLLDRSELGITYGDDLLACLELLRSSDNA